jgi:hypothetical protein
MPVSTTAPLLSQMSPANFPARHTSPTVHRRLYKRPFSQQSTLTLCGQSICSITITLDNTLHFTILFAKGSAGKLYRRTNGMGTERGVSDVRAGCIVAECCGSAGAARTLRCLTSRMDRFVPACLSPGVVGTAKCWTEEQNRRSLSCPVLTACLVKTVEAWSWPLTAIFWHS